MVERWTNQAIGELAAGISAGSLSMALSAGQGALFPALALGDHFWAVLEDGGTLYTPTKREIVRVTARSGDSFSTIERAQQGTTAQAFDAGARVELRITKTTLETLRDAVFERTPYARRLPQVAFLGAGITSTDVWGIWAGAVGTSPAAATLATTNQFTQQYRAFHSSTAAAAGTRAPVGNSVFRGATAGIGGFRFDGKNGIEVNNNGCRLFVGLADSPAAFVVATGNPSALTTVAMLGFGFDDTSLAASGNLRFYHHDGGGGAVTDLDTGISRVQLTTQMMYWCIRADPAAASVRVIAYAMVDGTLFDQTITTNLPGQTTPLQFQNGILGNGAANSIRWSYQGNRGFALPY